jgi:hypothetical protein
MPCQPLLKKNWILKQEKIDIYRNISSSDEVQVLLIK